MGGCGVYLRLGLGLDGFRFWGGVVDKAVEIAWEKREGQGSGRGNLCRWVDGGNGPRDVNGEVMG